MSRDLSWPQFVKQAKAAGFVVELVWLRDEKTSVRYGMVIDRRGYVLRRATLVSVLNRRRQREKKMEMPG